MCSRLSDPNGDFVPSACPMASPSCRATAASTVTYLLPVVAIVLGVLVLSETISVAMLAGIALVLGGVALTRIKRTQPEPKTQSE